MTAMLTSPDPPPQTIDTTPLPEHPPVGRIVLPGVLLTLGGFGGFTHLGGAGAPGKRRRGARYRDGGHQPQDSAAP